TTTTAQSEKKPLRKSERKSTKAVIALVADPPPTLASRAEISELSDSSLEDSSELSENSLELSGPVSSESFRIDFNPYHPPKMKPKTISLTTLPIHEIGISLSPKDMVGVETRKNGKTDVSTKKLP